MRALAILCLATLVLSRVPGTSWQLDDGPNGEMGLTSRGLFAVELFDLPEPACCDIRANCSLRKPMDLIPVWKKLESRGFQSCIKS